MSLTNFEFKTNWTEVFVSHVIGKKIDSNDLNNLNNPKSSDLGFH